MKSTKRNKILTGIAGEYFVAAELSRRGFVASITLRNTRGIDILASNVDATKTVGIQVKTKSGSDPKWILHRKAERDSAENLCYVFVRISSIGEPVYHVVPRSIVAKYCAEKHKVWLAKPGRNGRPHRDTAMRNFSDREDQYRDRWDLLGID